MYKLYCFTEKGAAAGYCECCAGSGDTLDMPFYTEPEMPITPIPVTESLLPENYTEVPWPVAHRPNDALLDTQWTFPRHNIPNVWSKGITGRNITIVVADDGLEWRHPDLKPNYRADVSYDLNSNDDDPSPEFFRYGSNRCEWPPNDCPNHGTKCAGLIAAAHNNKVCIAGVAHGARIGGIRMLDGIIYDSIEAKTLSENRDKIDIFSLSWGPDDNGELLDGPRDKGSRAIEHGVRFGRQGKGSLFIFGSGNGHIDGDNCGADGYANSMYTITFAAADYNGKKAMYCERCSAILSTIYSSGGYGQLDRLPKISTLDVNGTCDEAFGGTSAVNPIASGIIALGLEANPNLTWRDVQHIVVQASVDRLNGLQLYRKDALWQTNGAGRKTSTAFGFGLLDAEEFVRLSEQWPPAIPQQRNCTYVWGDWSLTAANITNYESNFRDLDKTHFGHSSRLTVSLQKCPINFVEHVRVTVKVAHPIRGALSIALRSPQGTTSQLLERRFKDRNRDGLGIIAPHSDGWPLHSVQHWGERPQGPWTLSFNDNKKNKAIDKLRYLLSWKLEIFGTDHPVPQLSKR